jgi:hypothetical protein
VRSDYLRWTVIPLTETYRESLKAFLEDFNRLTFQRVK